MNDTAVNSGSFGNGQTQAVDLNNVESALRQLWHDQQQDHGVVRACVVNLVILAGTHNAAEQAGHVIAQVMASHPCRALVLVNDQTAETERLEAWLSAHCQMPKPNGQRVCCEQVTLAAAGAASERLASAVLPLLVPDLPVVLWCMGEPPFGMPVFERLIDVADRLVVDTRAFDDPTFSLNQLAALITATADRIAVHDLNWAWLTAWQEQLAQIFDSLDTLPYLSGLERIIVQYARPQSSNWSDPEQALLLAGWLLDRTGWSPSTSLARVGTGHYRGRLKRANRELQVEIMPIDLAITADQHDRAGRLVRIELRGSHAQRAATFSIEWAGSEPEALITEIKLQEAPPLTLTRILPRRDLAALIAETLNTFDRDRLFEQALVTAASLGGGSYRR